DYDRALAAARRATDRVEGDRQIQSADAQCLFCRNHHQVIAYNSGPSSDDQTSKNLSGIGLCFQSSKEMRRACDKSSSKTFACSSANFWSSTFRLASSLRRNERLSKLDEPIETQRSSAIITLQ